MGLHLRHEPDAGRELRDVQLVQHAPCAEGGVGQAGGRVCASVRRGGESCGPLFLSSFAPPPLRLPPPPLLLLLFLQTFPFQPPLHLLFGS